MYFVRLEVRIGEYEDYSYHLIDGKLSRKKAVTTAIEDESRGTLEWENDDMDSAYDLFGEIYICISRVERISDEDADVLLKYL